MYITEVPNVEGDEKLDNITKVASGLSAVAIKDQAVKLKYRPGDVVSQADRPFAMALERNVIGKLCSWCLIPTEKDLVWQGPCCPPEPAEGDEVSDEAAKVSPLEFKECPTGDHPVPPPVPACVKALKPCSGPCGGSSAWYCSDKCQEADWEAGHRDECPLLAKYPKTEDYDEKVVLSDDAPEDKRVAMLLSLRTVRLVLRVLIRCRADPNLTDEPVWLATDGSPRSLRQFAAHAELLIPTAETPDREVYKKSVTILGQILAKEGLLGDDGTELVGWTFCMILTNAIGMHAKIGADSRIGSSLYGNESRFNHSCRANAQWVQEGTRLTVHAIEPILEGEQVFVNYIGVSSFKDKRRSMLKERYLFDCACVACTHHPDTHKIDVDPKTGPEGGPGLDLSQIESKKFDRIRELNNGRLIMSLDAVLHHLRYCFGLVVNELQGGPKHASKAFGKDLSPAAVRRLLFRIVQEISQHSDMLGYPDEGNTEDLALRYAAALAVQNEELPEKMPPRKEMLEVVRRHYYSSTSDSFSLIIGKWALMSLALHAESQGQDQDQDRDLKPEDSDLLTDAEQKSILECVARVERHMKTHYGVKSVDYGTFWSLVMQPLNAALGTGWADDL